MFYFTVIRATGWTYEYVDQCSLSRGIEFLECLGKVPGAQLRLKEEVEPIMNEKEALNQFSSLQVVMPGVCRIPPQLRDAIAWAEDEKERRGMN